MYTYHIKHIAYHYYHELTDVLNGFELKGFELVQILRITSNPDRDKMHRADVLFKKPT